MSSLEYCLFATFMHKLSEGIVEQFKVRDLVYSIIFLLDLVLNLIQKKDSEVVSKREVKIDQKSEQGYQVSLENIIFIDLLTLIPLPTIISKFGEPKIG